MIGKLFRYQEPGRENYYFPFHMSLKNGDIVMVVQNDWADVTFLRKGVIKRLPFMFFKTRFQAI